MAVTAERTLVTAPGRTGLWSWITTVDHKRIGLLYAVTAFVFFIIAGIEALLIRAQLAQPDGVVLSAEAYNQLFTMHGLTMVFLVVMPIASAFMNYMLPLLIGARDVAFPRLNAFSYWLFLFAGIMIYSSFVVGGARTGRGSGMHRCRASSPRSSAWTTGRSACSSSASRPSPRRPTSSPRSSRCGPRG